MWLKLQFDCSLTVRQPTTKNELLHFYSSFISHLGKMSDGEWWTWMNIPQWIL